MLNAATGVTANTALESIGRPLLAPQSNNPSPATQSFKDVLDVVRSDSRTNNSFSTGVSNALQMFTGDWRTAHNTLMTRISNMSPQSREMVLLQVQVSDLNLRTHLLTSVGETVAGTFRRVQQMGNG